MFLLRRPIIRRCGDDAVVRRFASLAELYASFEWAFANASTCSWGCDPRLEWVFAEERRLRCDR